MTKQILNNWQHGMEHDFTGLQEIITKTEKYDALVSRHNYLCSLVPHELTPATEPEVLMVLAETDRNMKEPLALMEELEGMCSRAPFFQEGEK